MNLRQFWKITTLMFNDNVGPFISINFESMNQTYALDTSDMAAFLNGAKFTIEELTKCGLFDPIYTRTGDTRLGSGVTAPSLRSLLSQDTGRAMLLSRLLTDDGSLFMLNFRRSVKGIVYCYMLYYL